MKLFPVIEKDGSYTEVTRPREKIWRKQTVVKYPIGVVDEDGTAPINEEFFELKDFRFRPAPGKQLAVVEVYISTQFKNEYEGGTRDMVIEKTVQDNAAWLFTYGERRSNELVHT